MAKRFFEVDVERITFATVNIVLDDQDPAFKDFFNSKTLTDHGKRRLLADAAGKASDEIVEQYDWEPDNCVDVTRIKEVTEAEARQFVTWDAAAECKLEP